MNKAQQANLVARVFAVSLAVIGLVGIASDSWLGLSIASVILASFGLLSILAK